MNRIELIKRWLLAQVQPELFYIPWNNNAKSYNVYIYSNVYPINKQYPDIETCKKQGIKPIVDYGFLIFDSKGKIVSYNSFCVPLKKGKYCAIHWTCLTGDLPSYTRKYVFFEVKDSDVYIFVEETTRSYTFEVKYEACTFTTKIIRNYVLQQYKDGTKRALDLVEYSGDRLEDMSVKVEELDVENIGRDRLLYRYHPGANYYDNVFVKNSIKEYNTVEKYRDVQTNNTNGYRVYFTIKEKNNNYNCERYDINLRTTVQFNVSDYEHPMLEVKDVNGTFGEGLIRCVSVSRDNDYYDKSRIYDYRFIAADKTWEIEDGLYTTEKGNIKRFKPFDGFYWDDRSSIKFGTTRLYFQPYNCYDKDYPTMMGYTATNAGGNNNAGRVWGEYVRDYGFYKEPPKEYLPETIVDTWVGDEFHFNMESSEIFDNPIGNSDEYKYQTYSNKYDTHLVVPEETINKLINNSIALFDSALPDDETTPSYFNPEIMDYTYIDEDGLTFYEYCTAMREIYENANASLSRYLFILGKDFNKYGYSLNPNGIYTLNNSWIIMPCYSQIGQLDEYKKTYCVIHYTPVVDYYRTNPQTHESERVLMILTPDEITEYFKYLMYTQEKLLQDNRWFYTYTRLDVDYVDNKNVVHYGNRIIINYKEIDITDDEYQEYQSQTDYSDKMEQIISEQNDIKNHILHLQKEFIKRYKEQYGEIPITEIPER